MSDARPGLHTGLDVRLLQNMPISACCYDSALHRVASNCHHVIAPSNLCCPQLGQISYAAVAIAMAAWGQKRTSAGLASMSVLLSQDRPLTSAFCLQQASRCVRIFHWSYCMTTICPEMKYLAGFGGSRTIPLRQPVLSRTRALHRSQRRSGEAHVISAVVSKC